MVVRKYVFPDCGEPTTDRKIGLRVSNSKGTCSGKTGQARSVISHPFGSNTAFVRSCCTSFGETASGRLPKRRDHRPVLDVVNIERLVSIEAMPTMRANDLLLNKRIVIYLVFMSRHFWKRVLMFDFATLASTSHGRGGVSQNSRKPQNGLVVVGPRPARKTGVLIEVLRRCASHSHFRALASRGPAMPRLSTSAGKYRARSVDRPFPYDTDQNSCNPHWLLASPAQGP